MVGKAKLGLFLSVAWWGVMHGQHLNSVEVRNDGAVPVLPPETVAAPTGQIGSCNLQVALDSLELLLLDIEIEKAQERLNETSFWKRIIPQVHVSASFGVRDVVFIDPTTFTPFILPRDAYRLTVSLSLSEILDFSRHSLAELELERLSTERSYRLLKQTQFRKTLEQQLTALREQLTTLQEEESIVQELLRFNQLRFEQGNIEFDTLMRTKLELLSVQKAIQKIQHQRSELQLKLSQGEPQ
jgi:hypothetical protein